MCGITGVYCWGHGRPTAKLLVALLSENQYRGTDSTGFAYQGESSALVVHKAPLKAEDFIKTIPDETWESAARSRIWLGHTRSSTKGDPNDNENNHPVVLDPWVVVHNGVVTNDDDLFTHFGVTSRFAEVDTAAIPLVLSQEDDWTDSLRNVALLEGNVSAALWSTKNPDSLALVRLGSNDIYLFALPDIDALVFSSSPYVFKQLASMSLGTLMFTTATKMPQDRLLSLTPNKEDCKLFGVNRNPIWLPRKPAAVTTTTVITKGKSNASYTWRSANKGPRPYADFSECILPPSFNNWDLDIAGDMAKAVREDRIVIPTPYGRWIAPTGMPFFFFQPHKSLKKYMRIAKLPLWWHAEDAAKAAKVTAELGDKLYWESFVIKSHVERPLRANVLIPGFVCPWCGAGARAYSVRSNNRECEWCEIVSLIPEEDA